jgi:SAM-dependent methyltransferase/uncharacterized protein YbaR (Trm112 family)
MSSALLPAATRIAAGPGVIGPSPDGIETPLAAQLRRLAAPAADPARNFEVEIEDGLLICTGCGRWYPVIAQLPEILPDHLRDAGRDRQFFDSVAEAMPSDLRERLRDFAPAGPGDADAGAHYKAAEMSIARKVDDPQFFGPGYSMPFNPWNPEFSLFLVTLFGIAASLLKPRKGETIVDTGCGYAWTTEWMHRSGLQAVGVDITRAYLEIGVARMGASRPHLIVADVERLPLQSRCVDAVLAYESFHHIPDRARAIHGFDRVLRQDGRIVLAEPDEAHETSAVAVDTMTKYGILERGMELADVRTYVAGTLLTRVEQVFVAQIPATDLGRPPGPGYLRKRRLADANLFLISRGRPITERVSRIVTRRSEYWTAVKRYTRRALRLVPGR